MTPLCGFLCPQILSWDVLPSPQSQLSVSQQGQREPELTPLTGALPEPSRCPTDAGSGLLQICKGAPGPGVCTQSNHRTLSPPPLPVTCSEVPCCHPTSYHWGAVATQFPYLGQPGGRLSKGQGETKGGVQGNRGKENNFLVSLRGLRNPAGVRRSFQVAFFGLVPDPDGDQ